MQVTFQKMLGAAIKDQEVKRSELETAIRCTPVLSRYTVIQEWWLFYLKELFAAKERWVFVSIFVCLFFPKTAICDLQQSEMHMNSHHSAPCICKLFPLMHLIP